MTKLSNAVFSEVVNYFMQGEDIASEERYRLTMTENEWARAEYERDMGLSFGEEGREPHDTQRNNQQS